jgi:16S rRNA (adenine1518-N6/adenine1519-N6)-dimethyltransferase
MPKRLSPYRRRFGQVFLRDPLVVEQIMQSVQLAAHETALEIGPGHGALTVAIAEQARALYAIELEARYVHDLRQRFAAVPHVHIIQANASTFDYSQIPSPLVVVANLPYSSGIHILRHLFAFRQRLSRLTIMLQKEVAARLLAPPGSSDYGGLSVFFQYYAAIRACFDVSPYAFIPRPAVDSTVLFLQPFMSLPWPSSDERWLFWLVKCAFMHRRKTLRKNILTALQPRLDTATITQLLATLHLDINTRAQELHVSQFVQLAEALHRLLPCQHTSGRIKP